MSTLSGMNLPEDDRNIRYNPQKFDSFSSSFEAGSVKDSAGDSSSIFGNKSFDAADDLLSVHTVLETPIPHSNFSASGGFSAFSSEQNGKGFDGDFGESSDGPILSSPAEMEPEEGFALREWRRQNAIRLEDKEKKEKEILEEIIEEADQYKIDFYRRRKLAIDNHKASNRDKEKQYHANKEKFHAEADKNYWKSIAELIPNEVATIEHRGKKLNEKKPSIVVIQGPKPGKPTDLSRMRQILFKLKHNTPLHMKPKQPPTMTMTTSSSTSTTTTSSESKKDPKKELSSAASSSSSASTSFNTSRTAEGVAPT